MSKLDYKVKYEKKYVNAILELTPLEGPLLELKKESVIAFYKTVLMFKKSGLRNFDIFFDATLVEFVKTLKKNNKSFKKRFAAKYLTTLYKKSLIGDWERFEDLIKEGKTICSQMEEGFKKHHKKYDVNVFIDKNLSKHLTPQRLNRRKRLKTVSERKPHGVLLGYSPSDWFKKEDLELLFG
jgi:hypothetical protein